MADCTQVSRGEQTQDYLARYLDRGVLSERDLLGLDGEQVRFRHRDSANGQTRIRSLRGADFPALLLQHVLPKGIRRARDFGLLHPLRKHLLARVQYLLQVRLPDRPPPKRCVLLCPKCSAPMRIVATRLTPAQVHRQKRRPQDHRSAIMWAQRTAEGSNFEAVRHDGRVASKAGNSESMGTSEPPPAAQSILCAAPIADTPRGCRPTATTDEPRRKSDLP